MRRFRFALGALAALVETVIAIALVFSSKHDSHPWLIAPFAIVAGWSFVVAGLVALWRRPENGTGFLLAATGYLWFVGAFTEANNEWVWTAGFVLGNLAFVAFVSLILAYPDGRLTRRDLWIVGIAGGAAVGGNLDHRSACPPDAPPNERSGPLRITVNRYSPEDMASSIGRLTKISTSHVLRRLRTALSGQRAGSGSSVVPSRS